MKNEQGGPCTCMKKPRHNAGDFAFPLAFYGEIKQPVAAFFGACCPFPTTITKKDLAPKPLEQVLLSILGVVLSRCQISPLFPRDAFDSRRCVSFFEFL